MGILLTAEGAEAASAYSLFYPIIMIVVIYVVFWFIMIRPQNKEKKRIAAMLANLEAGDSVLTTSGFYGTVIDIVDDTVIVEFGNNKNCRIPMEKAAISKVEKSGEGS